MKQPPFQTLQFGAPFFIVPFRVNTQFVNFFFTFENQLFALCFAFLFGRRNNTGRLRFGTAEFAFGNAQAVKVAEAKADSTANHGCNYNSNHFTLSPPFH